MTNANETNETNAKRLDRIMHELWEALRTSGPDELSALSMMTMQIAYTAYSVVNVRLVNAMRQATTSQERATCMGAIEEARATLKAISDIKAYSYFGDTDKIKQLLMQWSSNAWPLSQDPTCTHEPFDLDIQ